MPGDSTSPTCAFSVNLAGRGADWWTEPGFSGPNRSSFRVAHQ